MFFFCRAWSSVSVPHRGSCVAAGGSVHHVLLSVSLCGLWLTSWMFQCCRCILLQSRAEVNRSEQPLASPHPSPSCLQSEHPCFPSEISDFPLNPFQFSGFLQIHSELCGISGSVEFSRVTLYNKVHRMCVVSEEPMRNKWESSEY